MSDNRFATALLTDHNIIHEMFFGNAVNETNVTRSVVMRVANILTSYATSLFTTASVMSAVVKFLEDVIKEPPKDADEICDLMLFIDYDAIETLSQNAPYCEVEVEPKANGRYIFSIKVTEKPEVEEEQPEKATPTDSELYTQLVGYRDSIISKYGLTYHHCFNDDVWAYALYCVKYGNEDDCTLSPIPNEDTTYVDLLEYANDVATSPDHKTLCVGCQSVFAVALYNYMLHIKHMEFVEAKVLNEPIDEVHQSEDVWPPRMSGADRVYLLEEYKNTLLRKNNKRAYAKLFMNDEWAYAYYLSTHSDKDGKLMAIPNPATCFGITSDMAKHATAKLPEEDIKLCGANLFKQALCYELFHKPEKDKSWAKRTGVETPTPNAIIDKEFPTEADFIKFVQYKESLLKKNPSSYLKFFKNNSWAYAYYIALCGTKDGSIKKTPIQTTSYNIARKNAIEDASNVSVYVTCKFNGNVFASGLFNRWVNGEVRG